MDDRYEKNFTASPVLAVRSQPTVLGEGIVADDPEYTDHTICAACQEMELVDLPRESLLQRGQELRNDTAGLTLLIDHNGHIHKGEINEGCHLCGILNAEYIPLWLPRILWDPKIAFSLKPFLLDAMKSRPYAWVCLQGDAGLYRPQSVPERYDPCRAKLWVDNCIKHHERCAGTGEQLVIQGMHLIDCQTGEIVKAEPASRWVALSYVWGQDVSTESQQSVDGAGDVQLSPLDIVEIPRSETYGESQVPPRSTNRMPSKIPATVKDAMTVTLSLGYRYLWCDAYCIDQGHTVHKADQISKMDEIYRGAEITIVATGPSKHYGLPGVSIAKSTSQKVARFQGRSIVSTGPDPSVELHYSPWMQRAWTFQEGHLSKRLLVFTDHQMSFYCERASWMEALGGLEYLNLSEVDSRLWNASVSPFGISSPSHWDVFARYQSFFSLAERYTRRKLTHDSDSLNAFSGVLRALQIRGTLHLAGLPYVPARHIRSDMQEIHLLLALSWYHINGHPRRRSEFPSWTWAGWSGAVRWMRLGYTDTLGTYTFVRDVQFESEDSFAFVHSESSQQLPSPIIAIQFSAILIPVEEFIRNRTANSDDDATWCNIQVLGLLVERLLDLGPWTQKEFQSRLEEGVVSCLILGGMEGSAGGMFVLVVEWKDRFTAVRVTGFELYGRLNPWIADSLERRTVRLV